MVDSFLKFLIKIFMKKEVQVPLILKNKLKYLVKCFQIKVLMKFNHIRYLWK